MNKELKRRLIKFGIVLVGCISVAVFVSRTFFPPPQKVTTQDLQRWGYGQLTGIFYTHPSPFLLNQDNLEEAAREIARNNYLYKRNDKLIEIYYREVNPNEPSHSGRGQASDQNLDK